MIKSKKTASYLLGKTTKQDHFHEITYYIHDELSQTFGNSNVYIIDSDLKIVSELSTFGNFMLDKDFIPSFLTQDSYRSYHNEKIYCFDMCGYFIFEELKLHKEQTYYLIIGSNINSLADKFKALTGSNIVLIKNNPQDKVSTELSALNKKIEYATSYFSLIDIIKNISENIYIQTINITFRGSVWEASYIASDFKEFSFIIIDNVTDQVNSLNNSKFKSSLILLAFSILLFFIIYFLLRKSLFQLKLLGDSISLLGESRFDELRTILKSKKPNKKLDEIALIHNTAFDVTFHLEALEKQLRDNAKELANTLDTKTEQYLFLKSLLDYSNIIIIAYDDAYNITMGNNFLMEYIPIKRHLIQGMSIIDLLGNDYPNLIDSINQCQFDKPSIDEVKLSNKLGEHWISWMHCRIPSHNNKHGYSYLSIGVDITERKKSEQKLKHIAEIDGLTGIYNRTVFSVKLEALIADALVKRKEVHLLFIDLDKFKQINDRLGHDKGDSFLKDVANLLQSYENDRLIAGRLGGDEFAIAMSDSRLSLSVQLAKDIIRDIDTIQKTSFNIGIHSSASIGVAHAPLHGKNTAELISAADLAMYRAKYLTHDNFCVYMPNFNNFPLTVFDKRKYLNLIIQDDLIDIHLQPINHFSRIEEVYCYECLSRLKSQDGQALTPATIFKYAEECGLSSDLDLYILNTIFSKYAKLSSIIGSAVKKPILSINVSAKSIVQHDFINRIIDASHSFNIDLNHIIIEITETGEIIDIDEAIYFIKKLKSLGVTIALDDFGDGFASLRYLRNFPFDIVKIDGQFVIDIDQNEKDQIIVDSLVSTAKRFGMLVVVECVETQAAYNFFKSMNVDFVQGNFLAKPAPFEDVFLEYQQYNEKTLA